MDNHGKSLWTRILQSEKTKINRNQFWQAVWVWNVKPNVINRRLFASKILHCFEFVADQPIGYDFLDISLNLEHIYCDNELENVVIRRLQEKLRIKPCNEKDTRHFSSKSFLLIKRIYVKSHTCSEFLEICYINYSKNFILHYPIGHSATSEVLTTIFPVVLKLNQDGIALEVLPCWKKSANFKWLQFLLLPKLLKWAENADPKDEFEIENDSLKLVPVSAYTELYLHWKEKYGKQLVQNWTENTDPLKFVYEDVAIAVYLSLLWKNEKVTFVDLGCGNGLLVHILSQEGHKGRGIDLRPRKIWSHYQPAAALEVATISPRSNWHCPDADWIIGNHSDELTPWIPVFAACNSYHCKFFLLPCCAYEFNGKRYQRKNSGVSSYYDYIEYVKTISSQIGFHVQVDKMRIPSTKRTCLVGDQRMYAFSSYATILKEKIEPIFQRYSSTNEQDNFTPRELVERVRNCTKIDRSVSSKIEEIISQALIQKQLDILEKNRACDVWSEDYSISFKEAVSLLHSEDLKKLKNECGGLKTLLRNNHSVYLIQNGQIRFRKPTEKNISAKWKNRPCWFFHNHPLSCPIRENKCSFVH